MIDVEYYILQTVLSRVSPHNGGKDLLQSAATKDEQSRQNIHKTPTSGSPHPARCDCPLLAVYHRETRGLGECRPWVGLFSAVDLMRQHRTVSRGLIANTIRAHARCNESATVWLIGVFGQQWSPVAQRNRIYQTCVGTQTILVAC